MKRSEMRKKIENLLKQMEGGYAGSISDRILTLIEQNGMLPPSYITHEYIDPHDSALNHDIQSYYIDGVPQWETEE